MEKEGVLYIKYIVENNTELQEEVIEMVRKDFISQWLMGDELK